MFGSRASGNYQQARDAELVYRFKRQGRNAELFGAMIRGVAAHFGCGVILACPGHTQAETQLQKLLGGDLVRTGQVKSRKYNHKSEIDFDGEAATLELRRDIGGQRVLFVDDVATTGRALGFYRRFLTEHGATEVVCLVLGINERLKPTEADFEITYTTADAKTGAERAADHVAKYQDIAADLDAALAGIDWKRRRRAERDFLYFLRAYCTNDDPSAGASVLNPRNFDPATELSGIQHAMNILLRDGEATFMSEYQMQPPRNVFAFELTARHILSRIRRGVPPKTIPPATVFTAAATDINPGYAITTAITTFDIRLTALVTTYHVTRIRIPENLNDTEFNARLFAALKAHAREIVAQGIPLDRWGIDAGGRQFNTVTAFAPTVKAEFGIEAVAMLGRAGQNWNPNVRSRIRSEKNATILCRDPQGRRWLAWNADEYKEKMHRAWATEPGADGGLSLFDGNANHYRFAVQVANEKLKAKTRVKSSDGKERYAYKWQTKNPHDFGDCLAMCYALAGVEGLTGEGETMPKKKTRLAIGGKIVGAGTPQAETGTPPPEAGTEKPETGTPQQLPPKKKHRLAIGGRLY